MLVRLEVSSNKSKVKRVTLRSDAVIGRGPECNLRIASTQVSRQHCQIIVTDTAVRIRDLGSSNGTFLNGEPLPPNKDVPISSGAQIAIGPVRFVARFEIPPTSAEAPGSTVEIPVVTAEPAPNQSGTTSSTDAADDESAVVEETVVTAQDEVPDSSIVEAVDESEDVDAADSDFDFDATPQTVGDFNFEPTEAVESDEEDDEEEDEEGEYEDEETQYEDEGEEGEYEDEEEQHETPSKKGKLRSLFGLLRRKPVAAGEDEEEEEYEDEEFLTDVNEEYEDEEFLTDVNEEYEDEEFLTDVNSEEDEQAGSSGADELGDFLNRFENP